MGVIAIPAVKLIIDGIILGAALIGGYLVLSAVANAIADYISRELSDVDHARARLPRMQLPGMCAAARHGALQDRLGAAVAPALALHRQPCAFRGPDPEPHHLRLLLEQGQPQGAVP